MSLRSRRADLAIAAAVLLACAAGGPGAEAQRPPDAAAREPHQFTLAGTRYQILLAPGMTVAPLAGRPERVIIRGQGTRLQRDLILGIPAAEASPEPAGTWKLMSGAVLSYRILEPTGGGSGGPIAEMTGRLHIGGRVLDVSCSDQNEIGIAPDWCVRYLHGLRVVDP